MPLTIYGIANCDTVKKARRFLTDNKIDYRFHDFRVDGTDPRQIQGWIDQLGWNTLLNKRSTSWRQLDDHSRNGIANNNAAALLCATPTLIKRPVLQSESSLLVGFSETAWRDALSVR